VYNIIGLIATVNTFRGFWYLFDNYFEVNHDFLTGTSNELLRQINQTEHIENAEERDYHLSLINSQILGAFLLLLFHCGAQLHGGICKDVSKEKGHTLSEFYYTSYFYIKDIDASYGGKVLANNKKKSIPLLLVTESLVDDNLQENEHEGISSNHLSVNFSD